MIYNKISFQLKPFFYDLEFKDRITLVRGDSATGKTFLYRVLDDLRFMDEYNKIQLFNYKTNNFKETLFECKDSFIVIDNCEILIDDEVRKFINFECSNQFMLFLRNCNGLNVGVDSFMLLDRQGYNITLKGELD